VSEEAVELHLKDALVLSSVHKLAEHGLVSALSCQKGKRENDKQKRKSRQRKLLFCSTLDVLGNGFFSSSIKVPSYKDAHVLGSNEQALKQFLGTKPEDLVKQQLWCILGCTCAEHCSKT